MNERRNRTVGGLNAQTLRQLQMLSPQAQTVVTGWLDSNPELVKAWEADGSLLQRAKEAQDEANDALAKAKADGMTHLANHEVYELYGGPMLEL